MNNTDPRLARNEKVVRAFLNGWNLRNADFCMEYATEDMCYLNQPLEAIKGKANVHKMIASILAPAKRVEFELVNCFAYENKVITERVDRWDWSGSGKWEMELKVCGMFEVTVNGKIIEWREYYDNAYWTNHGGPSLVL
ncbi:limonene-1,2-epoxide hydrolase family protein [Aquisediminimonas sediminicola]|uniref:limonene-1,2-epoxide hydrolase family protein n=1 Tax=Alteraquisediminimonas sediminicola TaxID=2676787 RepID=UPI001C8EA437|nr:limonene-1,2-epoxide hydrolase family protein [Aquisediminimonas sediminicola]